MLNPANTTRQVTSATHSLRKAKQMSTRCNILLTDATGAEMWFYRHYDGYPEVIMPDLKRFMGWVKNGHLRDNVNQAGGWIVVWACRHWTGSPGC